MFEVLQLQFFQHALIAGFFVSIACGIIGPLVVINRMTFISGGIAHAAYGGIGLAFFLGISPILGAIGFTLVIAFILAAISIKRKERTDTFIGVIWAVGMAFGVILIDLSPGYNMDLMSFLFGSILVIPTSDLYIMLGLDILILLFIGFNYRELLAMSYDDEFAITMGVPVNILYFILIALIALTVIVTIRLVGLILVIALLTIPPYIAENYSRSLTKMMSLSIIFNLTFIIAGLYFAYALDITSGAAIIAAASVGFFLNFFWNWARQRI